MGDQEASDNNRLVVAYLRARQLGDLDTYTSLMTDDIVRYAPRPSLAHHVARGKDAVVSGIRTDLFQPGTLTMEVERIIAEGDLVAVQFILRGTTRTGKHFENYQHFLMECRDGKVSSEWEYLDTLYAADALGTQNDGDVT
jgi:ketosteroid isomerase-like protein